MLTRTFCVCASILIVAAIAAALPAAESPKAKPEEKKDWGEAGKLIEQLGDPAKRDEAQKKLKEMGNRALPALEAFIFAPRPAVIGPIVGVGRGDGQPEPPPSMDPVDIAGRLIGDIRQAVDQRGRAILSKEYPVLKQPGTGEISEALDPALETLFPKHQFWVLRFRQFPVALQPPEPFVASQVLVAPPDGKPRHLKDAKSLEAFLKEALPPAKDEAAAQRSAWAAARLAQELHQDGFYRFSIPDDSLTVMKDGAQLTAKARAVVEPRGGNQGFVAVELVFAEGGKLSGMTETAQLKEGVRPICQATKLLDPDPIVRRMAERDILVMGRAAKPYLDQQWERASPEVRREIERLWKRIVAEDR